MGYYSAIKKNENLPFVTAWIDLQGIMVSEISQWDKRQIAHDFTHGWNVKNNINEQTEQKPTDRCGTDWWLPEGRKVGEVGEKVKGLRSIH